MDVGLLSTVKVLMSFNEDVVQRRSLLTYHAAGGHCMSGTPLLIGYNND